MMPHWNDLKYFLCVCESKNISRASELLGISQPSLSLAIKRLEIIAQVPLFVRSKNGVDLTREGHAFRERSEELLGLWQTMFSDIKKAHDEVSGCYVIGAHSAVAQACLMPVIKTLMATYPRLELAITHGLSRIITDQVISFAIDFALVVNPSSYPDLVITEIGRDRVGFFASPKLMDKNTLIYDPNLLQSQALLKAIKSRELSFARTITSSSLEVVAKLTQEGIGIGLLPGRVAQLFLEPPLVLIDEELPHYDDRFCLIYRADAQKTKSARKLAGDLKRLLLSGKD